MNKRSRLLHVSLAIFLLLWSNLPAAAFEAHFAGFGTASLSSLNSDQVDYVVNDQPEGPGRSSHYDAGLDSLLGVQLDLGLSDSVEFALQLIADRNEDGHYTPDATVAQLRWHPTDALTLRIGRMPTPAFLHSENRQIRYSMPWVRPPLEVYGLVPAFSSDGLEIIHTGSIGPWHSEWHGGITRIDLDTPLSNSDETFSVESYGPFLNLSLENHNTRIKFGYAYTKTSFTIPEVEQFSTALRLSVFPGGAQLADDLAVDDSPTHTLSIGVRHETCNWLLMGEFGYRAIDGFFRDQYGVYATLGKRLGPWMPYITVARRWTQGPETDSRAGFLSPQVDMLLASTRYDSSSLSLGLSREIRENIILKFQTDWLQTDKNSWGLYTNHAPSYAYSDPDSNWLFTLSLDFVF